MNWIYAIPDDDQWNKKETTQHKEIHLRPIWKNKDKLITTGVVSIKISSANHISALLKENSEENANTDFYVNLLQHLQEEPYFLLDTELSKDEKNHYLNKAELFVDSDFDYNNLMDFVRYYLTTKGYPFKQLQKAVMDDFNYDINPFFRAFKKDFTPRFDEKIRNEQWQKTL